MRQEPSYHSYLVYRRPQARPARLRYGCLLLWAGSKEALAESFLVENTHRDPSLRLGNRIMHCIGFIGLQG